MMAFLKTVSAAVLVPMCLVFVFSRAEADPVQGGVLGAAVGGAIGGGAGLVTGAVLGGAGGASAEKANKQEQERWKNYYDQQEKLQAEKAGNSRDGLSEGEPLPRGSGLIKEIQRSLSSMNYEVGKPDGLSDGMTMDAIRQYQEDHHLMITGKPSQGLLRHMREQLAQSTINKK